MTGGDTDHYTIEESIFEQYLKIVLFNIKNLFIINNEVVHVLLFIIRSERSLNKLIKHPFLAPDKKLFTPGPLLTSRTVKEAMLRDLGSRDSEFIKTIKTFREGLLQVAGCAKQTFDL